MLICNEEEYRTAADRWFDEGLAVPDSLNPVTQLCAVVDPEFVENEKWSACIDAWRTVAEDAGYPVAVLDLQADHTVHPSADWIGEVDVDGNPFGLAVRPDGEIRAWPELLDDDNTNEER